MQRTNHKLDEAKFFLKKMEENYTSSEFDFYLSAFISACRSVLWVLAAECKKINGWEDWYKSLKPDEKEKEFLKATNELRVRSEKHSPLVTDLLGLAVIPPDAISILPEPLKEALKEAFLSGKWENLDIKIHTKSDIPKESSNRHFIPFLSTNAYRQVPEFEGQDILKVCSRYYNQVTGIVDQSKLKFSV
ncbi:hypothetical protein ACJJIU_00345 [Microbulbifer sp. CnH-101-E]|uniref:hypothetical protein n=1 Tax=unclassified Microbulbifer TaxID=2619833 RepID=UPI00403970C6